MTFCVHPAHFETLSRPFGGTEALLEILHIGPGAGSGRDFHEKIHLIDTSWANTRNTQFSRLGEFALVCRRFRHMTIHMTRNDVLRPSRTL